MTTQNHQQINIQKRQNGKQREKTSVRRSFSKALDTKQKISLLIRKVEG
jgi:hypothetical protein